MRAFCAAVSALKGGSGGRLAPAAGAGLGDIGISFSVFEKDLILAGSPAFPLD